MFWYLKRFNSLKNIKHTRKVVLLILHNEVKETKNGNEDLK